MRCTPSLWLVCWKAVMAVMRNSCIWTGPPPHTANLLDLFLRGWPSKKLTIPQKNGTLGGGFIGSFIFFLKISPLPGGNGIQFDLRIFFIWVETNHQRKKTKKTPSFSIMIRSSNESSPFQLRVFVQKSGAAVGFNKQSQWQEWRKRSRCPRGGGERLERLTLVATDRCEGHSPWK